jgi:hypothetical protein
MRRQDTDNCHRAPVVVAPDSQSVACVCRALEARGIEARDTATPPSKWAVIALERFSARPGLLILVPSPKLGSDQLRVVSRVVKRGGMVLAWTHGSPAATPSPGDQWIVESLLKQCGARASKRLPIIALAAEIYSAVSASDWKGVTVSGPAGSVKTRLIEALTSAGVFADRGRSPMSLEVSSNGLISLRAVGKPTAVEAFPSELAEALELLSRRSEIEVTDNAPRVDEHGLSLFLQPPARLLSEVASKKLFRMFGIDTPKEQLCQSPSEAVRFAKTLAGKAVFKLVKPRLEGKQRIGAVIRDVEGPAAQRRAVHTLTALGNSLGKPKMLGVLVAEQIVADTSVWLKMTNHRHLGRLVLMGSGHRPDTAPETALPAPATFAQAYRALVESGLSSLPGPTEKLALAVSRFATLVDALGPKIDRAEIHPLVADDSLDSALALDALISITG